MVFLAAPAGVPDPVTGIDARFHIDNVNSSGAADGFDLCTLMDARYKVAPKSFNVGGSGWPIYRCTTACRCHDGGL